MNLNISGVDFSTPFLLYKIRKIRCMITPSKPRKHPVAQPFLFFSEMWERFGYYLMIGIFTLYLKDVKAGFGMTEDESA